MDVYDKLRSRLLHKLATKNEKNNISEDKIEDETENSIV